MLIKRLLVAACIASSVAIAPASAQPVAGPEVQTILRGKTFNTKDFGGEGTIAWNADNTIAVNIRRPDGSTVADTGTFRFDGNGYCSTWKTLRTTEKCFTLRRTGATTFDILNPDGSLDSTISAI